MGEVHPLMEELRVRRLLRGWTLADVERMSGVPDSTVSNWECGAYQPSLRRLEAYAAVFGLRLRLEWEWGKEDGRARTEDRDLHLLREGGLAQGAEPAEHVP